MTGYLLCQMLTTRYTFGKSVSPLLRFGSALSTPSPAELRRIDTHSHGRTGVVNRMSGRTYWDLLDTSCQSDSRKLRQHSVFSLPLRTSGFKAALIANWQNPKVCNVPSMHGVKMRLKGKTIYIHRKYKRMYFFKVGKSHPAIMQLMYGVFFKHKQKQRIKTWSYSYKLARANAMRFYDVKRTNIYHGRGVRPVRFLLFKKEGKVSAYR